MYIFTYTKSATIPQDSTHSNKHKKDRKSWGSLKSSNRLINKVMTKTVKTDKKSKEAYLNSRIDMIHNSTIKKP